VYGGGAADQLPARGQLGTDLRALVEAGVVELVTGFAVTELVVDGDRVTVVGTSDGQQRRIDGLHTVVAATGSRPDLAMLSEVQLDLSPALEAPSRLAPLVDPQFHSCGTVPPHGHRDLAHPDEGLYVVGSKSYGRAPTFLVATGNEQVRSVVAALAGDLAAADEVQLVLPETGVCSVDDQGRDTAEAGGCCGTDAAVPDEAHRSRPAGVPAQGFVTGVAGGGRAAELALADSGAGGCCAG
jgi:glycine/D-amino acid oxidase-like deaminating enzyme